jgi:peptidoglycan/xylan/chitin deacetylase (PgdA/CDA1 family)
MTAGQKVLNQSSTVAECDMALRHHTTADRSPRRAAFERAAATLWRLPGNFGLARIFGRHYSLRCVLFHDVAEKESPFTKGLGVTVSPSAFEATLRFLTKHYTPVRLCDVLADPSGRSLPARPVLVTFDDGYASVAEVAVPLCVRYGVPAVFFLNASCVDDKQLALDNLICYSVNVLGLAAINAIARVVTRRAEWELSSMAEIFERFLPTISLEMRELFRTLLLERLQREGREAGQDGPLYVTSQQLQNLATTNFEIGNHTYSHVHCRLLSQATFRAEIDRNKAELEGLSGSEVRAFSVPYGSAADLTDELLEHLSGSGHQAVFMSESVANPRMHAVLQFDRVSAKGDSDARLFAEIEVLPRLRALRNLIQGQKSRLRANQNSYQRHIA